MLTAAFIGVSNMPGIDPSNVRRGYERVVKARLADAKFYFDEDRKIRLEDRLPLLEGMVFGWGH
jgi:glycyl-tRNA synthetase beta chain